MPRTSRKTLVIGALLAALALNASLVLASSGVALPGGSYFFGPAVVRAEIVVKNKTGVHDIRFDRGRLTAITGRTLTITERDETVVSVPVAQTARITLGGIPVTFGALRRGMKVETTQQGDEPAETVVATRR